MGENMRNANELLSLYDYEKEFQENIDFNELEKQLESDIQSELENLQILEEDRKKISDPASLGDTIRDAIWEQFQAQIGLSESQEFVKENNGLPLDLRNSVHIQTEKNFAEGKIATHNYISKDKLEQNYDRFKNTPHKEFRKEFVNPEMDKSLPRAGDLNKQGIDSVPDIYNGRQIPTDTKLADGKNNPLAAQREHVTPSAEIYKDPSLQMAKSNEELASIINNPENLQGYTTAERNNRKSDKSANEMENRDKNQHWKDADKKSKDYLNKERKKGEQKLKKEGRQTQKEEAVKAGKATLQSILLSLLQNLIREIFSKLVQWFTSANKSVSTLLDYLKNALQSFILNFKEHFKQAASIGVLSIVSMIFAPIARLIKSVFTILKQGAKSIKQAILYFKDKENQNKSFGVKILEVSKIVMAGLTGIGAIALGEIFEKLLMNVPGFSFEIPILGSVANIVGIFLGAIVAGVIGSIVLNCIDRLIAKRQKQEITGDKIEKRNEILQKQNQLTKVKIVKLEKVKSNSAENICKRHTEANEITSLFLENAEQNNNDIDDTINKIEQDDEFEIMMNSLKNI